MRVEKKILKASDKAGRGETETVFPKGMILFILLLSAILMFLILLKN